MNKITSVLSILSLVAIYCPSTKAGDFTAVYHECLKQARAKYHKEIIDACAADAALGLDRTVVETCQKNANTLQVPETENRRCYREALRASGREDDTNEPATERRRFNRANTEIVTAAPAVETKPATPASPPERTPPRAETVDRRPPAPAEPEAEASPAPAAPAPTGFTDTTDAEIEADQDIARCAASQSSANECCNNPLNCSSQLATGDSNSLSAISSMLRNGTQSGGLVDYCNQMNNLGYNAGNVNTGLASICAGSHTSCSSTCADLARKYGQLLESCDGCAAQTIYENARSSLMNNQTTCTNMRTRSDQLALTGLGAANNQAVAEYCGRVAGNPASLPSAGANVPKSNSPFINHLLAYNCDANPSLPDCKAIPREPAKGGEAGFAADMNDPRKNAEFNLPDPARGFRGYTGNGPDTQAPVAGRGARVNAVPNNSGGQMLGSSGFAEPAKLSPKPTLAAAPGAKTEVENGFQGGSGYSPPAGNHTSDDGGSYYGGYAPAGTNAGAQFESIDLRQFLPGGSRAAGRRFASEINPKEENLFIRISNKMIEKCRLGVLWQCR